MYNIKTDIHVHSIFTNHAYSTIDENARYANETGIELLAITDHFGPMFIDNPTTSVFHFNNRVAIPRKLHGVTILKGVEIDIVDHKGNLAFSDIESPFKPGLMITDQLLSLCNFAIASVHQNPDFRPATEAQHTEMYINALRNPYIDMIGHSGRAGMKYDINEVIKVAKEEGKIIEINNHSFEMGPSRDVCKKIAEKCAELGVYVAANSDAHFAYAIGHVDHALDLLEEIHFPEELIANANEERLLKIIREDKKGIIR